MDLQRQTGRGIDDLGESLSWRSAAAVISHLQYEDSALAREITGTEINSFATRLKTNTILADICDLLGKLVYMYNRSHGGHMKPLQPYPRPGAKSDTKKIGKGAISVNDLRNWIESKRRKHKGA